MDFCDHGARDRNRNRVRIHERSRDANGGRGGRKRGHQSARVHLTSRGRNDGLPQRLRWQVRRPRVVELSVPIRGQALHRQHAEPAKAVQGGRGRLAHHLLLGTGQARPCKRRASTGDYG